MTSRPFFYIFTSVAAISVVAGGAFARRALTEPTLARAPDPVVVVAPTPVRDAAIVQPIRQRVAALEAASSFAPALRLRTYLPSRAEAPKPAPGAAPPPSNAAAPQVEPPQTSLLQAAAPQIEARQAEAPLPPLRPAALVSLSPLTDAPLPPTRPGDLAQKPVVVASLAPVAPAPAPDTRAPLAETAPLPAPPPKIEAPVASVPFAKGQPAYVRIFKKEGQLELWLKRGEKFELYKTFPICKWSGHLGPKMREGDYQSPEGFYSVSTRQLHPKSNYHLAFNIGFPNALDKQRGYTGGLIMVHGDCQSVGCYAMTNKGIDKIYAYVAAALANGQKEVPVHIFPFRMTDFNMAAETGSGLLAFASYGNQQHAPFWRNLKEGYDLFEKTGEPPTAYACRGRYAFNASAACKRIAGW